MLVLTAGSPPVTGSAFSRFALPPGLSGPASCLAFRLTFPGRMFRRHHEILVAFAGQQSISVTVDELLRNAGDPDRLGELASSDLEAADLANLFHSWRRRIASRDPWLLDPDNGGIALEEVLRGETIELWFPLKEGEGLPPSWYFAQALIRITGIAGGGVRILDGLMGVRILTAGAISPEPGELPPGNGYHGIVPSS